MTDLVDGLTAPPGARPVHRRPLCGSTRDEADVRLRKPACAEFAIV